MQSSTRPVTSVCGTSQGCPAEHRHGDKTQRNQLAERLSYPFFLSSRLLLCRLLDPGDQAVHLIHCVLVTRQLLEALGIGQV